MAAGLLALGAGLATTIGGILSKKGEQRRLDRAIEKYKNLLISEPESIKKANMYGDAVTTQGIQSMNEGAYSTRGLLNPETVRTMGYAKLAGQRAATEIQSRMTDENYNRNIKGIISEIGSQRVDDNAIVSDSLLEGISTGAQGYLAGRQMEMQENYQDFLMNPDNEKNIAISKMFSNSGVLANASLAKGNANISTSILNNTQTNNITTIPKFNNMFNISQTSQPKFSMNNHKKQKSSLFPNLIF